MTDDHNRCEWVNVSSGTSSPGLSRTSGHETFVVVILAVILCVICFIDGWFGFMFFCTTPYTVQMHSAVLSVPCLCYAHTH